MEKHKIMDLFSVRREPRAPALPSFARRLAPLAPHTSPLLQDLGTRLIHDRPTDPNKFLLETLQAKQAGELEGFFSEANVKTMFGMFDLVGRGFLTPEQYRQALRSLGVDAPKTWPLPPKVDKVDLALFTANMRKELGK